MSVLRLIYQVNNYTYKFHTRSSLSMRKNIHIGYFFTSEICNILSQPPASFLSQYLFTDLNTVLQLCFHLCLGLLKWSFSRRISAQIC